MPENYIQIPTDTSNTGKKIRTNQRTVGANDVEEHFMIIQDATNNFQAQVISGNVNTATGLAVWAIQAGSYNTYGTITTGSENYIKAGSIQTYNPVGIGSVQLVPGSLEVYQLINSNLQVQATQETNPWIVSGTSTIAGSIFSTGSINIATNLASIGSINIQTISGVITIDNRIAGSIVDLPNGSFIILSSLGSVPVNILTSPVPISGIINIGLGSVRVTNDSFGSQVYMPVGSVYQLSSLGSHGVYGTVNAIQQSGTNYTITQSGTSYINVIQTTNPWVISGTADILNTVAISGIVNQGTTPWTISGIVNIGLGSLAISNFAALGSNVIVTAGSIRLLSTTGSSPIYNSANPLIIEQERGIYFNSGASVDTSGTAKIIYTPGAGSKVLLKGFMISAELATKGRLIFSGGTPTHINTFNLPNSGTIAMNLLGMEPSGAVNQPISVGLFNNGSIHITVFGRETL